MRRGKLSQIGELAMPAIDLVWAAVRNAGASTGHNVFVYRPTDTEEFEMEMGVQLACDARLPPGEVAVGETPAGRAVHALHRGPYDKLNEAFDAIREWAEREGVTLGTAGWEVYGDWTDDPEKLETDVYLLLA
jgi:effector-binding domain-containing protein